MKGRCRSAHSLSASKEAALGSWRPLSFVLRVGRHACSDEGAATPAQKGPPITVRVREAVFNAAHAMRSRCAARRGRREIAKARIGSAVPSLPNRHNQTCARAYEKHGVSGFRYFPMRPLRADRMG